MERCQETSGFLFNHRCGRPGAVTCATCQRLVCAQHARTVSQGRSLCVTCLRREPGSTTADSTWNDDPYFYSSRYHGTSPGDPSTSDPMDYTEGDQGRLADPDAGEPFEDDMGGS
jgi:hypothetical protein